MRLCLPFCEEQQVPGPGSQESGSCAGMGMGNPGQNPMFRERPMHVLQSVTHAFRVSSHRHFLLPLCLSTRFLACIEHFEQNASGLRDSLWAKFPAERVLTQCTAVRRSELTDYVDEPIKNDLHSDGDVALSLRLRHSCV